MRPHFTSNKQSSKTGQGGSKVFFWIFRRLEFKCFRFSWQGKRGEQKMLKPALQVDLSKENDGMNLDIP